MAKQRAKPKTKIVVGMTLPEMLDLKPFGQLVEDGHVFVVDYVAKRTGYTVQHIRRLCHAKKIPHVVRGGLQYVFLPLHVEQICQSVFKSVKAKK